MFPEARGTRLNRLCQLYVEVKWVSRLAVFPLHLNTTPVGVQWTGYAQLNIGTSLHLFGVVCIRFPENEKI